MSRSHRTCGSDGRRRATLLATLVFASFQLGCVCSELGSAGWELQFDAGGAPSKTDAGRTWSGGGTGTSGGGGLGTGGGSGASGGGTGTSEGGIGSSSGGVGTAGGGTGAAGGGTGASGGGTGTAGGGTGTAGGGAGTSGGGEGTSGGGAGGGAIDAGPPPEVCDGVDNDGNGIVDDVDVGADGVCDCLGIGTIGFAGTWGSGNVATDWLPSRTPIAPVALAGQVLTASALAPFKILIVQDVRAGTPGKSGVGSGIGRTYSETEVDALTRWVQQGGGLIMLSGYLDSSEVTNSNRLLAPFALSYGTEMILYSETVTHWATHPLTTGVTSVTFGNGHQALGNGTAVAWQPAQGAYDVGRATTNGNGRIVIWGDERISYSLEWSEGSETARLWLNVLRWLSGDTYCQVPLPR